MNKSTLLSFLFAVLLCTNSYSQDDIQVGRFDARSGQQGGLFDYSNPSGINIKVQVWGYVRYPGFYVVPAGTGVNEILSFAGGPMQDARLDDIRVTKIKEGIQTKMIKYNYNDLMYEEGINSPINFVRLEAGDIIIIPGEPRYFVREDVAFYLGIVTTLASLTALILSILSFNN